MPRGSTCGKPITKRDSIVSADAWPAGPTLSLRKSKPSSTWLETMPPFSSFKVNDQKPPGRQGATPALAHTVGTITGRPKGTMEGQAISRNWMR